MTKRLVQTVETETQSIAEPWAKYIPNVSLCSHVVSLTQS
jgi:hypothetical protein